MVVSCNCSRTKQSRCYHHFLLDSGIMILPIMVLVFCYHTQTVQSFQSIQTIHHNHHPYSFISTTTTTTTTTTISMTPTNIHSDIDTATSTYHQRGYDHTDYNSYSKICRWHNNHRQKYKQLFMSQQNCNDHYDCEEDISSFDDDVSLLLDTSDNDDDNKKIRYTSKRRNVLQSMGIILGAIIPTTITTTNAFNKLVPFSLSSTSIAWAGVDDNNNNIYVPAIRPTVYRVDSTIPPTLLPLSNAREQLVLLQKLGMGSGTNKEEIVDDSINLNNMLNKAVFGTIDAVNSVLPTSSNTNNKVKDTSSFVTSGDCTFVALGIPSQPKVIDIELALNTITINMLDQAIQKKKNTIKCAVGLACLPYSTQNMLNEYTNGIISSQQLQQYLLDDIGLSSDTIALYSPVWETIQTKYNNNLKVVDLLAMAPDIDDRIVAFTKGLQFINSTKRSTYVIDPNGFINQVNDPKFLMYTDRSLLKDNGQQILQNDYNTNDINKNKKLIVGSSASSTSEVSNNNSKNTGGFFAERILFHEAAATSLVNYVASSLSSSTSENNNNIVDSTFVTFFAPVHDVRYLNGINGRISRISQYVANNNNNNKYSKVSSLLQKVNDNCITTILINPTSIDTLSLTKYLRLEIGTGPDSIQYQSKLCDYIWFSQSPKVNLLPRVMN